jgi:hypothetical protein
MVQNSFPKRSIKNVDEDLYNLPYASGLYYFYDKDNNLLYIGKAKKLKSRILNHKYSNNRAREAKFYSKFLKMNLPPESRKKLDEAIRDFEFRGMSTINPVAIDFVFDKVTLIEIEEMPHELTERRETDMIWQLKPRYNSETGSDEYYELMG